MLDVDEAIGIVMKYIYARTNKRVNINRNKIIGNRDQEQKLIKAAEIAIKYFNNEVWIII